MSIEMELDTDTGVAVDRRVYVGVAVVIGVFMTGMLLFSSGLPSTGQLVDAADAEDTGVGDSTDDTREDTKQNDTGVVPSGMLLAEQDLPGDYVTHDEGPVRPEDIKSDEARELFVDGYYTFWGKAMNVNQGVQQTVFVTDPSQDNATEQLGIDEYLEQFNWTQQDVTVDANVDSSEVWHDTKNDLYFVYLQEENVHMELVVTDPDLTSDDVVEMAENAADSMP